MINIVCFGLIVAKNLTELNSNEMKKIPHTLVWICILFIGTASCSKSDGKPEDTVNLNYQGSLYYSWADEGTLRLSLNNGEKSVLLPADVKRNGFFVNRGQGFINNLGKKLGLIVGSPITKPLLDLRLFSIIDFTVKSF